MTNERLKSTFPGIYSSWWTTSSCNIYNSKLLYAYGWLSITQTDWFAKIPLVCKDPILLAKLRYDFTVPPKEWLVRHPLVTALLMDTANYEMSYHTAGRKTLMPTWVCCFKVRLKRIYTGLLNKMIVGKIQINSCCIDIWTVTTCKMH